MTRKFLMLATVGVAVLVLMGAGIFFLTSNSGAVADTAAEAQDTDTQAPTTTQAPATTSAGTSFKINIPWSSGWISQVGIDEDVTEQFYGLNIEPGLAADARYFTKSTTSYYYTSQVLIAWESMIWDFTNTPLSNDSASMTEFAKNNQAGMFAWAESLAGGITGVYAPVAKQVRVLPLDCGDSAYAVQVNCQWGTKGIRKMLISEKESSIFEFLLIPKSNNQYFTIVILSNGMCEDDLWDLQRSITFTKQ